MPIYLDLKYGLRKLFQRQNLRFTVIALLCIACGVGACVAVFSVTNAVLLRPLPGVEEPSRLVSLTSKPTTVPGLPGTFSIPLSYPTFLSYQEENQAFSELAAYQPIPLNVLLGERSERMAGQLVSGNYFTALGVQALAGRVFTAGDARQGAPPVVVVSRDLARRLFADPAGAVGKTLLLNGQPFEMLGVAPRGFHGTVRAEEVDVWVPLEMGPLVAPAILQESLRDPAQGWLFWFFGRLRPGLDAKQAQARMDALAAGPDAGSEGRPELLVHPYVGVRPGTRRDLVTPLRYLAIAVALLMLVACANVGGLLLVRAVARQGEIGVRLALGASRGTLLRQLLTESLLLSFLGAAAGLGIASAVTGSLEGATLGHFLPALNDLHLDLRVLVFTLVLALVAPILFGLVPALWASRPDLLSLLRHAGAGRSGGRLRIHEGFVVVQGAVSVVLIVTTVLLVRTLGNLSAVDPGFAAKGIVNLRVDLELQGYEEPAGLAFFSQLTEHVRGLGEVESAALAFSVPLSRGNSQALIAGVAPRSGPADQKDLWIPFNVVSPGYFHTLGIPLLHGTDFSDRDRRNAPLVTIVNEEMARQVFPEGTEVVGQRLEIGGQPYEVRAVVGNVRHRELVGDPEARFYLPLLQHYQPSVTLHVKSRRDPSLVIAALAATIRRLDPYVPLFQVRRFEDEVRQAMAQPRLLSWLFGAFGLIAFLVTATGLYGVLAFTVSRRFQELGVRMAFGARPREIVALVLRQALSLTLSGLVLGLTAAAFATRGLAGVLCGVSARDPLVFLAVTVLWTLVGLAASVAPALAAARVDPTAALHCE